MFSPPGHLGHFFLGLLVNGRNSAVDGGGNEVFQHFDILGVNGLGLDLDSGDLVLAGHGNGDHLAAGGTGVLFGLQLLLLGADLVLHFLDLAHHGVGIGAAVAFGQSCFHGYILQILFVFNFNINTEGLHVFQRLVNGNSRRIGSVVFELLIGADVAADVGNTVDGFFRFLLTSRLLR